MKNLTSLKMPLVAALVLSIFAPALASAEPNTLPGGEISCKAPARRVKRPNTPVVKTAVRDISFEREWDNCYSRRLESPASGLVLICQ